MIRRPSFLSQLWSDWSVAAEAAPTQGPLLNLETLEGRAMPSAVLARVRQDPTITPAASYDEVVLVADNGSELVLFSQSHGSGYGASGASAAVADSGDVVVAFTPSYSASTVPSASLGGLFRYSPVSGSVIQIGTVPSSTFGLDIAVTTDGTVVEARTRNVGTSQYNEVVALTGNGAETVLFSEAYAQGYGANGASVAVAGSGDLVIAFTPNAVLRLNPTAFAGGLYRYSSASGKVTPIGPLNPNTSDLDIAVTADGSIIGARTRFTTAAPYTHYDEVVAFNGGTETVLFSEAHAIGYGAVGASAAAADNGDVVIAFGQNFYAATVPGASTGGFFRYSAATGTVTRTGAVPPRISPFDLAAARSEMTVPPAVPPEDPAPEPPTNTAAFTLNLTHDAIVSTAVGGQLSLPVGSIEPFAGYTDALQTAAADVNGDGVADVFVATASSSSHVKLYDGATGALLRSFLAFEGYNGGVSVGAADIDGDGTIDLIVGTLTGSSHVKVLSGKTDQLLDSFFAFDGFTGGVRVTGTNNADGTGQIAIGTATGPSHVKVFKGQSLTLMSSQLIFAGYTGGLNVGFTDVNGDGTADLLAGTAANSSHVVAVDGKSQDVLVSFLAFPGYAGGVSVAGNGGNIRVGAAGFGPPQVTEFDPTATAIDSFMAFDEGYLGGVLVS